MTIMINILKVINIKVISQKKNLNWIRQDLMHEITSTHLSWNYLIENELIYGKKEEGQRWAVI